MSTRLRVLLTHPQVPTMQGPVAIACMCRLLNKRKSKQLIQEASGTTKREKLAILAKQLPPEYTLILIQEPRHTRKSRSYYWASALMLKAASLLGDPN